MNQDKLTLVSPAAEFKTEYLSMVEDFRAAGEKRYQNVLVAVRDDFQAYIHHLEYLSKGNGLRPGYIPYTSYWMVHNDSLIVGTSRLRHQLTPALEHEGGHIGYNIRPSQRHKGYGTHLLALTLEKARDRGLTRVLLTCDTDNVASVGIIENNHGKLENRLISNNTSKLISRYWIDL